MEPIVSINSKKKDSLTFTISNLNVSLANALRRTILSQIPIVVIRSRPYEKNDVTIHINTTRLNNEILKQRLSCIPIYIRDQLSEEELKEYEIVIDKKNTSDVIEFITTEDFKIMHRGKELADDVVHKIFPPDTFTKDYILFARLRPKISNDLPGEELKLTAKLSIGNAQENSMFNVASTCSYRMTPDIPRQNDIWDEKASQLEKKGVTGEDIEFEKKNWFLDEGKRIYLKDSFDFILETLGIFSNTELIKIAIKILNKKLSVFKTQIENDTFPIKHHQGTTPNSFDLTLQNESYTLGKVLEFILYYDYFITDKTLSYVGFLKKHPHDDDSIIRMAFKEDVDTFQRPLHYLDNAIQKAQQIFSAIEGQFN